ncbi:MAG: hypothetical protein HGA35_01765 [Erysipelotrichaceae bacterium]|nr:hypothetical protein [Erysipelotrichaceae bacterium]
MKKPPRGQRPIIQDTLKTFEEEKKSILADQTELNRILEIGQKESQLLYEILDLYSSHDRSLHDPIAIMAISDPELFEFVDVHVDVETGGHFATGATIPDFRKKSNPNLSRVKVAMKLEHAQFMDRLIEILKKDA